MVTLGGAPRLVHRKIQITAASFALAAPLSAAIQIYVIGNQRIPHTGFLSLPPLYSRWSFRARSFSGRLSWS